MAPAATLLDQLAAARRAGATWEAAWPGGVVAALLSADPVEREGWREAFWGTAEAWRCAFERRPPSRAERALSLLGDGSDREQLPERPCQRCGEEIPAGRRLKGAPAKFCGDDCRRAAYNGRPRVRAGVN